MHHRAIGANDGLFWKAGYAIVHFAAGRYYQLRNAVVIRQIDEVDAAMIAPIP
jgi:hypothetical protein